METQVEWEGETYRLDLDDIDTVQARYIKRETGYTPTALWDAFTEIDPDAAVAAYWLMMKQSDKPVLDISRINIKIVQFATAVLDAMKAAGQVEEVEGAEAESDPKDPSE